MITTEFNLDIALEVKEEETNAKWLIVVANKDAEIADNEAKLADKDVEIAKLRARLEELQS
jgi:hypothetical protein